MSKFSPEGGASPPEAKERQLVIIESDFEDENGERAKIEVDKGVGLFLFDIDETLVNVRPAHGEAIKALYQKHFETEIDPEVYFKNFGLGEYPEQELLLDHYGIKFDSKEEKDRKIRQLMEDYGSMLDRILSSLSEQQKEKMIIPGAKEILKNVERLNLPAVIVTGNVQKSARSILKNFGLAKYFITGGFADDPGAIERSGILKSAIDKAQEKGLKFPPEQMVIIGDTPKDHTAAFPNLETRGANTLLVATGDHGLEKLDQVVDDEGRRADLVLPKLRLSLKELSDPKILERLGKLSGEVSREKK